MQTKTLEIAAAASARDYRSGRDWAEGQSGPLYAWGLPAEPGTHFQFGYEAEFTVEESDAFLSGFYPVEGEGPAQWSAWSLEERRAWLRERLRTLGHGDKRPLLTDGTFTLHRDDTGNVELALGPYDSLAEFERATRALEARFGCGSLQAMVSVPRAAFFAGDPSVGAQEQLGWLNFFHELDVLERMEAGYARWERDPACAPLRSFLHPYLGPMVELRHKLQRKFLRENARGELLDAESLIRPGRRDQSFKFVGSTAYRPDIAAPSRVCFEVRDAHRDPELLRNRVARVLHYWRRPRAAFLRFCELPAFDSAAAFDRLPEATRDWLARELPFRAPPEVLGFEKPRFTYEVFRNFAYPLRDWDGWLRLLGDEARAPLERAQNAYLAELAASLTTRGEAAARAAQVALVRFARASGLLARLRDLEQKLAEGGPHA